MTGNTITTKDGTQIYFKDWGTGHPVVFSHGWPLTADAWESQMFFLASNGYRCIAHDRRGHGRSSQPWNGNDMDTYADDLAQLFEALDLKGAAMIGHSTGGGEVARFIGRHGTKRVSKAVLVGAVPPIMVKTAANPGGLPIDVFDGIRQAYLADRAQFFLDFASGPFFGFNRPGAKVSQGLINAWLAQGMMAGHKNAYDCIKAFSETDFTEDLKRFDVPTLIVHGDDDQIVPIGASALLVLQARQGRDAQDLQGRRARIGRHLQGAAQRRPARVPEVVRPAPKRSDAMIPSTPWTRSALFALLLAAASPAAAAPAGFSERFADVNGTRIRYLIGGSGSPVVLLHGYAQTGHMWDPLLPRLVASGTPSSSRTCAAPAPRPSRRPATTRRTWRWTSTSSRDRCGWAA